MITLGIESTCDESAVALVRNGKEILANCVASQADIHKKYGGVFPEIAAREHIEALLPLIKIAFETARLSEKEIDLIAVAEGPGLMGSLLMGTTAAEALSFAWNKPLVGVNHVDAHLYSAMMEQNTDPIFPCLGLVLSGGHTFLAKMESITHYHTLGSSVDDAIGEAFDKVATLLDLSYPGGPEIEKLAVCGNPLRYPLKAGQVKNRPLDFSFSGLKTNALYTIKGYQGKRTGKSLISEADKKDFAASFQKAAFFDIIEKTKKALKLVSCDTIYLGGGVTCNTYLQKLFRDMLPHVKSHFPSKKLCIDNGAMIAGLGFHLFQLQYTHKNIRAFSSMKK